MTIKEVADTSYLTANYHTHTRRCQHAVGTEREYIEAAIQQGIEILGFSDHIPCPFTGDYVSHIRMTMDQAEAYVTTLRLLQKEYAKDIRIYIGFEAEYIPEFLDEQRKLIENLAIDYMIMGQHFLQSEEHGPYVGQETTSEQRLKDYVDSVIQGMGTGLYRYLAHPDLVHYVGDSNIYKRHMKRLCQEMKKMHIPLEINMLGMVEGRQYPRKEFWELAACEGNAVILGIDAHAPGHVIRNAGYDACCKLIQDLGLKQIHRLKGLE